MDESVLRSLMRLFAIVTSASKEEVSESACTVVKTYLEQHLGQRQVDQYYAIFERFLGVHKKNIGVTDKDKKSVSARSVKLIAICHRINEALQHKEKIIILIRLLEYTHENDMLTSKELDFIAMVADIFRVDQQEYEYIYHYVVHTDLDKIDVRNVMLVCGKDHKNPGFIYKESGNWIEKNRPNNYPDIKWIYNENLTGSIVFLYLKSVNGFVFKYTGIQPITHNGHVVKQNRVYAFTVGSVIKGALINSIYYQDVISRFLDKAHKQKISFTAIDLEYHFSQSENGIHPFSFSAASGELIGIMGGSGVGKSTLINLFNGSLAPSRGKILINGYDLSSDSHDLDGLIGSVPQDDLLIEDLTVFENLYFNSKLCFGNYTDPQILHLCMRMLVDLELNEIKDLKVGSPLTKFISGGQRKRLNIALELIRQPSILFVDEPTSGLSSVDSETVMNLLKEQTLNGKLVVVNIHQPSSDIFKMFDKILILDKGGYVIYDGNPVDAIEYFKSISHHVNAMESECLYCGNINPEQILHIVETKELNLYGKFTKNRKVAPLEWYEHYKDKIASKFDSKDKQVKVSLPKKFFQLPSKLKQLKIFLLRNGLAKLANRQYLVISFLQPPVLAFVLAFFTKSSILSSGETRKYIFSLNENIPAFIFMSVIVAMFIGLTVSVEEIIHDRTILKRESFLNLSRISYLHAKILTLFLMSAIQTLTFVLIGNAILGIKGHTYIYWLALFSASCFSNMLGLNISSSFKSVVTVYVLIPFVIVPQLLFSGVLVDFSKLHESVSNIRYTPFLGDAMVARWAYEAVAVQESKANQFDKNFYIYDKGISEANYKLVYELPYIETLVDQSVMYIGQPSHKDKLDQHLCVVRNQLLKMPITGDSEGFWAIDSLNSSFFSERLATQTKFWLKQLKDQYNRIQHQNMQRKDSVIKRLTEMYGKQYLFQLKQNYSNNRLKDLVTRMQDQQKIIETKLDLIQLKDPIYQTPDSPFGRAQLFFPQKKIFHLTIDTFYFNVIVIWFFSIFLYFCLRLDLLRKLLDLRYRSDT